MQSRLTEAHANADIEEASLQDTSADITPTFVTGTDYEVIEVPVTNSSISGKGQNENSSEDREEFININENENC